MGAAFEAHRVAGGDENETRFFGARNNLDLDPGFAPDARHEFRAVFRLAHRAGRDRAHPIDVTKFDELLEVTQGPYRKVHRLLTEAAGFKGAASEANGFLDPVNHVDVAVAIHVGNHHVH